MTAWSPPRPGRSDLLTDALLAEAMRKGWLTAPTLVAESPLPRAPVMPLRDLLADLAKDRADR